MFAKLPTTGDDRFVVVGIALLSAVLFIFVRGAKALPHLNKYVDDMAGVGPRATRSTRVFPGGVEHKTWWRNLVDPASVMRNDNMLFAYDTATC